MTMIVIIITILIIIRQLFFQRPPYHANCCSVKSQRGEEVLRSGVICFDIAKRRTFVANSTRQVVAATAAATSAATAAATSAATAG